MDLSGGILLIDNFPQRSHTHRSQSGTDQSSASLEAEVEQIVCDICEELDVRTFESCWEQALNRSPLLRGALRGDGIDSFENALPRIAEFEWIRQDWRGLSTLAIEQRLKSFLERDRQRKFAGNRALRMRFALFRVRHVNFRFIWSFESALLKKELFDLTLKKVFNSYEAMRNSERFRAVGAKRFWQIHFPEVESETAK